MVWVVFAAVVGARFLVPLLIPRYPLPAILACLVLDAVDQTIFQAFGHDPPGYQGYDKAMDVFYLAIAYISTLRNWTSVPAFRVGRFLYFYRLVGVVSFELSQLRALLLVFPNTFEYFFIAYQAIRSRWDPRRLLLTGWIVVAAVIWVCVKLPQEWWIHVAKLDVTDLLAEHPWVWAVLVAAVLVLALAWRGAVRPRVPRNDWPPTLVADPLPEESDTAAERAAWRAEHGKVRSWATVEKALLVGLLAVIFAQTVPGVQSSDVELFVGIAVLVVVNEAMVLAFARREVSVESLATAFGFRLVANVALAFGGWWFLGDHDNGFHLGTTAFFMMLLSLLTTLHDRYLPVHALRERQARPGSAHGRTSLTG